MQPDPILLGEPLLSTNEVSRVSGVPMRVLRGWVRPDRAIVTPGHRPGRARHAFTLLDAIRLAAMHDLTARVPLGPSVAAAAADHVVRAIEHEARRDTHERPIGDPSAFSRSLALAVVMQEGAPFVALIDGARPGEYMDFAGPWGRAHVVVPIGALVADVLWRFMELRTGTGS